MKSFVKGVLREHNERQNKNTRSKQENEIILVSTTAIVFVVIVTLEVTIIVMGNLFTIFSSWHLLTYSILVNLFIKPGSDIPLPPPPPPPAPLLLRVVSVQESSTHVWQVLSGTRKE